VPATAVLPLAEATVNLLVAMLKLPRVFTAVVETCRAESVPLPSDNVLREVVMIELSEVLSRPVYVLATVLPVSDVPISVLW